MAKKLFVRYAQPSDEKKIFDFYSENEHEFVAKRDPDVWRERIASGADLISKHHTFCRFGTVRR